MATAARAKKMGLTVAEAAGLLHVFSTTNLFIFHVY